MNYDDDSDDHSGDGANDVVMILWTRMPAQLRVYDDNGGDDDDIDGDSEL